MVYSRAIAVVLSTLVDLSFNGVYGAIGAIDEKERATTFRTRSIEPNPKAIGEAEGKLLKVSFKYIQELNFVSYVIHFLFPIQEDVGVAEKSIMETFDSTEEESTRLFVSCNHFH